METKTKEAHQSASLERIVGPMKMRLWSDDFDMDLMKLFPKLREQREVAAADYLPVWAYASTGWKDVEVFAHPCTWNGIGAPYFSQRPCDARDNHGWLTMRGGLTTNSELCCISAFDAVRDCWSHNLRMLIDWELWTETPCYNGVFYPIMSHIRGWSNEPEINRLMEKAQRWAARSCRRFLERVNHWPNDPDQR